MALRSTIRSLYSPGSWLPFEPSLVHMSSIVCSANASGYASVARLYALSTRVPDVFCHLLAIANLLSKDLDGWYEEWDKRCPFELYLL